MKNKFSFWKPVKVKPLFSFKKPIAPIKLAQYPTRTKTEWKLIDRKPWGDSDRDRVINIFDCKPMNRKKQGYLLKQDIAKRLFNDPTLGVKTRPQTKRRKEIREMADKIIREDYQSKQKSGSRYVKGKGGKAGEYVDYKRIPKMSVKIHTEKDIVRFFERNPHLIKQAEKYSWELLSPNETLNIGLHGSFGRPVTVEEALKGKEKIIKIFSAIKGKRADTGKTKVHELEHGKQKEEGYWEEKYHQKDIWDVKEKMLPALNKLRQKHLLKAIEKDLKESYNPVKYYAPISGKTTDWEKAKKEIEKYTRERYKKYNKEYYTFSPEEIEEKVKEAIEKGKGKDVPYYQVYNPHKEQGQRFEKVVSRKIAAKKIQEVLSMNPDYIPLAFSSDIPYKDLPEEKLANLAAKKYKAERKALSGEESPELLTTLDEPKVVQELSEQAPTQDIVEDMIESPKEEALKTLSERYKTDEE